MYITIVYISEHIRISCKGHDLKLYQLKNKFVSEGGNHS